MLFEENANVALKVVMQRLFWFFLHRVRYLSLVWSKQEGAEKCMVMGRFYTEHQRQSLDSRNGF